MIWLCLSNEVLDFDAIQKVLARAHREVEALPCFLSRGLLPTERLPS